MSASMFTPNQGVWVGGWVGSFVPGVMRVVMRICRVWGAPETKTHLTYATILIFPLSRWSRFWRIPLVLKPAIMCVKMDFCLLRTPPLPAATYSLSLSLSITCWSFQSILHGGRAPTEPHMSKTWETQRQD